MIAHAKNDLSVEPVVHRMTITPSMALNWLEHANSNNRRVSDAYVDRLARDMKQGRWRLTHEGIAFDPHGVLLDGQHRLWAIVQADLPIEMHVWFNIGSDTLLTIGQGHARSLADAIKLAGEHGRIVNQDLSVLRAMLGGITGRAVLTSTEASEALARHRDAVRFAIDAIPQAKHLANAVTRGVVARAWYSADHGTLAQFGRMLVTGIIPDTSLSSVILLRQYLQTHTGGGYRERRDRYAKTQRALAAYLNGEQISKLYAATQEYFPLPEEVAA